MGQNISREMSVDLFDLPTDYYTKLIRTSFTVRRTDGREQEGWQIPAVRDPERDPYDSRMGHEFVASHACREFQDGGNSNNPFNSKPWNFFMVRYQPEADTDKKLWGWRVLHPFKAAAFWPTELTTNEEREAWKNELCQMLDTLTVYWKKTKEQQAATRQLQDEMDRVAVEALEKARASNVFSSKEEAEREEDFKKLFRFSPESIEAVVALLESRASVPEGTINS
jgi:hypothetical protein